MRNKIKTFGFLGKYVVGAYMRFVLKNKLVLFLWFYYRRSQGLSKLSSKEQARSDFHIQAFKNLDSSKKQSEVVFLLLLVGIFFGLIFWPVINLLFIWGVFSYYRDGAHDDFEDLVKIPAEKSTNVSSTDNVDIFAESEVVVEAAENDSVSEEYTFETVPVGDDKAAYSFDHSHDLKVGSFVEEDTSVFTVGRILLVILVIGVAGAFYYQDQLPYYIDLIMSA